MIILDIGHSYIKAYDQETNKFEKIYISDLNAFSIYLQNHKDKTFWIGSVNLSFKEKLETLLETNQIQHHYITHEHFKNLIKIDTKIDLYEVGIDILSIIYYVDDTNYLFINNGTALLYIKYSTQLDGVIISNNILFNTDQLLMKTNLSAQYVDFFDFGTNTSDAISAGISFSFKQTVKTLLEKYDFNKIYVNGIDQQYLENLGNIKIKSSENTTLKGYIKLINTIVKR